MNGDTIVRVALDRIAVGERLRAIDPDWVALIAESLAERGQDTPILVGPADGEGRHPLIAGAHRLEAARRLGWAEIAAVVRDLGPIQARLAEIDENLMRRELSELDRAVFLAERAALWEALHPEIGRGGDRRSLRYQTDKFVRLIGAESFAEQTAQKVGLSPRHIRRALARARLEPELRAALAPTRWADHGATLDALVRETPERRRALVEALTRAEAPAPSLAAARAALGLAPAPRPPEEAALARLENAWRRAGRALQRRFLDRILAGSSGEAEATAALLHAALSRRELALDEGQDRVVRAIGGRRP
jgi:ParB family chromosome partitioning protein